MEKIAILIKGSLQTKNPVGECSHPNIGSPLSKCRLKASIPIGPCFRVPFVQNQADEFNIISLRPKEQAAPEICMDSSEKYLGPLKKVRSNAGISSIISYCTPIKKMRVLN